MQAEMEGASSGAAAAPAAALIPCMGVQGLAIGDRLQSTAGGRRNTASPTNSTCKYGHGKAHQRIGAGHLWNVGQHRVIPHLLCQVVQALQLHAKAERRG